MKLIKVNKEKDEVIQREYFLWLCDMVAVNESEEDKETLELCWFLHKKDFTWTTPNDDNRAEDGKKLRQDYADQHLDSDCPCLDGPCSIFEMLIGLAQRMDYIISDNSRENKIAECFWEMVDNLGLEPFLENDRQKIYDNEARLEILLERKYSHSGRGGLFPLERPRRNQRTTELWYQMQAYIKEKYKED